MGSQGVKELIKHAGNLIALASSAAVLLMPTLGEAQEGGSCAFLCAPELKIEPTVSFENLGSRARVEVGGVVQETQREAIFELLFALGVPTVIPQVGLTFEVGLAPFASTAEHPFTGATAAELGRDEIRDNVVEFEAELNLYLIESDQTGGWLSSHFDIVDKFSPGERPGSTSAYTHKLNFEWDTALHPFNSLPEGRWLRNLEVEISIDYVATGIPRAGDLVGDELYLDDASAWSLSLVLVVPLAPLDP
jgi:hypothetical protein